MKKTIKFCFIAVLFFCTIVMACPVGAPRRAVEEEDLRKNPSKKEYYDTHWGITQQRVVRNTTIITQMPVRFFGSRKLKNAFNIGTMTWEEEIVKKEITVPVPLSEQAEKLREDFKNFPVLDNQEVSKALQTYFDTQLARIIYEHSQNPENILGRISKEFPNKGINKGIIVIRVQNIAKDQYKKIASKCIEFYLDPKVKAEVSKLLINAKLDPSWQSKKYPINPHYIGNMLDKFSDSNSPSEKEAVNVYNKLVAQTKPLDSVTVANLSITEDANAMTIKSKQSEPLTPVSLVKAD